MGDTDQSASNPIEAEGNEQPEPSGAEADTSAPLLKKEDDSADSGKGTTFNHTGIVYDPDDGLDFESSMAKAMVPMVFIFLGLGWVAFTLMDDMDALDGLYMTFITITTVGYGDFSPQQDGTKIFFIFWIFFGLSVVATGLAMMVDHLVSMVGWSSSRRFLIEIVLFFMFVGGGALWVCMIEEFSFIDGLYWAVCTLTTVGYGDQTLKHQSTRMFVCAYALFGTALTVTSLATMACLWVEYDHDKKVQEMIDHGLTLKMLNVIDVEKSGSIDKFEFLRYMLWKLDKVDGDTMDMIIDIFNELDIDGGGTLGPEDMKT